MTNIVNFPDRAAVEEEAAVWLVRLDGGGLPEEQRPQLRAWLAADPTHPEALRRMAVLWGQLDSLRVLAELFPREETALGAGRRVSSPFGWLREHGLGVVITGAVTASLVLALVFSLTGTPERHPAGDQPVELVYQTEIGKQSTALLEDGSTMTLNTQSLARVRFGGGERAVHLEKGEAHFAVAKNPQMPFVVYAGNGKVRAVGTAFSVRLDERSEKVDVVVTEGTVQVVAGLNDRSTQASVASAGSMKTITLTERGIAHYQEAIDNYTYAAPREIAHKLAWKSGKWIFEGETLGDVIAEANRYTSDTIEIDDPDIAKLRVGGYFRVGEVESLLSALEAGFDIVVTRPREGIIQLSSRNDTNHHTR